MEKTKTEEGSIMENRFEWRAEIRFKGTEKEFAKLAELVEAMPAEVAVPDESISEKLASSSAEYSMIRPRPFPGEPPYIERILGMDRIKLLTKDNPIVSIKFPDDIAGGIRTAHLHIGDKVVLLDRNTFKKVVLEVATEIAAKNVDAGIGFPGVMASLDMLDLNRSEMIGV